MVVPDDNRSTKSFQLAQSSLAMISVISATILLIVGIFLFDYFFIIKEVYQNKYLKVENGQLREQIQVLELKMNSVLRDIERVQNFERKIRVMTGAESGEKPYKEKGPQNPESYINLEELKSDSKLKKKGQYRFIKNLYQSNLQKSLDKDKSFEEVSSKSKKDFRKLAENFALLDIKLSSSKNIVDEIESSFHEIDISLLDRQSFFNSTPSVMPTKGWVTSYFGPRMSHYAKRVKMHEGIDIGARSGTSIISTADGKVVFAGRKPGFGNFIKIQHGFGVETIYAHAKKLFVRTGKVVKRGDLIAAVGSTGYSTGPHVHYEVRVNETPVDPLYFILN